MIDWKVYDKDVVLEDKQYLVYCDAPNYDSDWIDIARYDNGVWHAFRSLISHASRVKYYAEINYPEEQEII